MKRSHRVAWELTNRPIPEGMLVCHRCDNPPCCRPDHLFLGTHDENMADKSAKGRARGREKLKPGDAADIRTAYASGVMQKTLAERYGLHPSSISNIIAGRNWN